MKNIALILAVVALWSCGNKSEHQHENHDTQDTTTSAVQEPEMTHQAFTETMVAYFDLKDALIKSDAQLAIEKAETLEKVSLESKSKIAEIAAKIKLEKELEAQRTLFSELSQAVYEDAKANEGENTTLYRQYCPMAFDNTGGYWLSNSEDILNPYFGDKMLKCGRVEETI